LLFVLLLLWYAGVVKSTKMTRTIVVRRDYLHYIKKYARCDMRTQHQHAACSMMTWYSEAVVHGVSMSSASQQQHLSDQQPQDGLHQ
jgi:hypothetical protein